MLLMAVMALAIHPASESEREDVGKYIRPNKKKYMFSVPSRFLFWGFWIFYFIFSISGITFF
jgi:hypothetical protein